MKQIIHNNKYDPSILRKCRNNKTKTKIEQEQETRQSRWARFIYVGSETRRITKLFRGTNVKVTYTTNNNLGKLLDMQTPPKRNKYDRNGVYQLTRHTCRMKYIGQTGRPFQIKFREHYNGYKYANNRSKFAQHVIDEGHSFGPMDNVMDIVHIAKKGKMLDTLKIFYIYRETQNKNKINDKLTVQTNPIFEVLLQHTPHRGPHSLT